MKYQYIYNKFKYYIDIILIVLTVLLSIKKGGFYASDSSFYTSSIIVIFVIYLINEIVFKLINNKKSSIKNNIENNKTKYIIIILSFLLYIAYLLPVIFNKCVSYNDAINESLRYFSLFAVIFIVSNSNNKKKYMISLIVIGLTQVLFGIDGISSRHMSGFLKEYNTGYLSKDLDRLSGTIQYANLTGLIFTISSIICFKNLVKYVDKIKKNDKILKFSVSKFKYIIINIVLTLLFISILLTKSKMILLLYLISLLVIFLKENIFIRGNILIVAMISFLASTNIDTLIYINKESIYFTSISYIILSIIVSNGYIKYVILNKPLHKYILNKLNRLNEVKKTKGVTYTDRSKSKKLLIGMISIIFIVVAIYSLTLFKTTLKLSESSTLSQVERTYYNLNKDNNEFGLEIEMKKNSSMHIDIIAKDRKSNYIKLETNKIDYLTNEFNNIVNLNFKNDNYKCIILKFYNIVDEIEIKNISLNGDNKTIQYLMLPSDLMFRIKDTLHLNSTSLTDRFEYYKDSIKIWNKNKLIGRGGETFKYEYKFVQTLNYNSTEVHNIYLQTLVESGVIGFIILILLSFIIIKQKTNVYIKMCLVIFLVHSIFDLNFSYLIGIVIFGIISGVILNNSD